MGRKINGVLGPVDTEELGYTLIHEHAYTCCDWSLRMELGSLYFEGDVLMDMAIQQLQKARAMGITTVVDGSPINLGRDTRALRRLAEVTGVNIIASSGFYHDEGAVLGYKSEDELVDLLMGDCTQGMADTDSLPGILKCAVDHKGFTSYVRKILNVTAQVSAAAKLPIFCHTIPELFQGNELMDVFDSHGIPANAVVCGHSGDSDDISYLESVLQRGCYLGIDRFGIVTTPATLLENRAETLYQLCARGWTDKLLISHDYTPYTGFFPTWPEAKGPERMDDPVNYGYFQNYVAPLLLKKGLSQEHIRKLTVDNPRRFFEDAYA